MRPVIDHVMARARRLSSVFLWAMVTALVGHSAIAGVIAQTPLFLTKSAKPMVMLVMSKDHQLFYKAYNDYSDLDGDGTVETTYKPGFEYYGYFDSKTCYDYSTSTKRFTPADDTDSSYYCQPNRYWSGNFLNWVTMSRMDIVRKLLYGGKRITDTGSETVLERAYLPTDAHSWVKYYDGNDMHKLTPFSPSNKELSFCNTTHAPIAAKSQTVNTADYPPLMMVAKGNYSLWAANERWQCYWKDDASDSNRSGQTANNGNDPAKSGIDAKPDNPSKPIDGLGEKEYAVRVQVCGSTRYGDEDEICTAYPNGNRKPTGLLQQYADSIQFGLITNSYNKNISGGVLRKNISDFTNEVNSGDGTFTATPGIVSTLNKLRMYGYYYGEGTYLGSNGDNCDFQETDLKTKEGTCTSWGNPISEMYLEALRYYAGATVPTSRFNTDDTNHIAGLTTAPWTPPLNQSNACAVLNTVVFNASVSSYDGDNLDSLSDISVTSSSLSGLVNNIGAKNGINGQKLFVGQSDGGADLLCTGKTTNSLSSVKGICPEAPTLEGTYNIAGLAHYAHTRDLQTNLTGDQTVKTFGVALSPAVPRIEVPVGNSTVTILPAYVLDHPTRGRGAGTLVDFKIVSQSSDKDKSSGKFYVNWEDSEQGGDYDQDMWGTIAYEVKKDGKLTVTTDAIAQSTANPQGFGYIISGTTQDGFHAHSGILGFNYVDTTVPPVRGCINCQVGDDPTSYTYTIGSSRTKLIEQPLYYASKWGGFKEDNKNPGTLNEPDDAAAGRASEWDADGDNQPDNYFFVTDPTKLATSLQQVFSEVEDKKTSASAVAANSTGLQTDTLLYQAQFDSTVWKGDLVALPISTTNGSIGSPVWRAAAKLDARNPSYRTILTLNPKSGRGIPFQWAQLDNTANSQQSRLNINPNTGAADGRGQDRLNFLRGDHSKELQQPPGIFRNRDSVLGDIVNSAPAYVTAIPPFNYPNNLESGESYADFITRVGNRPPMIYAGANDGMLHGFRADTGNIDSGDELLAYVPNRIFVNLPLLTDPGYNDSGKHRYFVDGPPTVGDVFFASDSRWHTVLVGSLGAGGQGLFALDVTSPSGFIEGNAAQIVKWEFTDADDPDLGYTIGQPSIVKMQNGDWVAIVGNGYKNTTDSGNRHAVLFIIRISDGTILKKIDTGVGSTKSPNGLSTPAAIDYDGDDKVDYIYAGDLQGNLWKFNVTGSSPVSWDVAFKSGTTNQPLFKAPQPITVQPEIGRHLRGRGGFMVYFGTGKYFENGDNATTAPQSFYGIWDRNDGSTPVTNLNQLQPQTVIQVVGKSGSTFRLVSDNPVDWSTQKGWYLALPTSGERVVADPTLSSGRIIFVTAIPSQTQSPCDSGGQGWLMELDANNGGRIEEFTFNIDNDTDFDDDDLISTVDVDGDGNPDTVAPGGQFFDSIIQRSTIIGKSNSDTEYKYSSSSKDARIEVVSEYKGAGIRGRVSWEQLR